MTAQPQAQLAADLALALDPVRFARAAGKAPDPWQASLLCSSHRQIILNCSRQSGKSTMTGVKALHVASYRPRSLVLLVSPSERQSKELLLRVKDAHRTLGALACPLKEESVLEMRFENGSRIIALPGTEATVRSYSNVTLLVIDEASRVRDEMYEALRPMLAVSKGQLILLSTPFGKVGFFYREWREGGRSWQRIEVTAEKCPRIEPEWLDHERETQPAWYFRQEYGCEFVETDDQVFSTDLIKAAITDEVKPLFLGGE